MDSLFDQDSGPDSAPSAESDPAEDAPPPTTDRSVAEPPEEARAGHPDGSDSIGSGVEQAGDGVDREDGNGVGPVTEHVEAGRVEPDDEPASSGGSDPGPPETAPAEPEAPSMDLQPAAVLQPVEPAPEPETTPEPSASAEPEAAAVPEAAVELEPSGETPAMPASSLPPPPTLERALESADAPSWPPAPPTTRPAPATDVAPAVPAAPSAAGPAPSQVAPRRRSHAGIGRRLANRGRQLLRWPEPVRATSGQRGSSLVMLFVLAVAVGVVGSALLVGVVFLILSILGHGSGG